MKEITWFIHNNGKGDGGNTEKVFLRIRVWLWGCSSEVNSLGYMHRALDLITSTEQQPKDLGKLVFNMYNIYS